MKKVGVKILGMLIILIFILQYSGLVWADEIKDLQNEQSSNEEKINNAKEQKEQVVQEKSETVKQVEELDSQISDYETQINELDTKITDLNNKIADSEAKLKQKQEDYDKQQKLLEERLVATYEAGETSYLDVLLSSSSITDLISNYYLISEVADHDQQLMRDIKNEQKEIEEAKTTLETSQKELESSKSEKQSMSTQLQSAKAEKNQYVAQLSEQEQDLQAQIEELAEANKSIDAEIKQKQAEIQKKLQQQKPSNGGSSSGGSSSGGSSSGGGSTGGGSVSSSGFIYPVPSGYTKITTGMYYSSGQYHGAVDFGSGGINGQPVYAVADGIVVTAKALNYSYGNYIIIAHYNGLYTLYAHGQAGSIRVSEGQYVSQGQQIMNVGNTGNSFGAHLHFEVRTSPGLYNNRVNPTKYLP